MKDNTLSRLGGICSILLGVSYVVIGVTYVLLPAEQQAGGDLAKFFTSFAQNPTLLLIQYWSFALGALLAIAAVLAISQTVRAANEGWVRWTSSLAIIGFAVTAIDNFRVLAVQSARATAFVSGDAATKAALLAPGNEAALDPQGWLGFGAVGLWVLVVSWLAIRGTAWPKYSAYAGIAVGVLSWVVVAGFVLNAQVLVTIAAALGGIILAPIWYIWLGFVLRREPAPVAAPAMSHG